MIVTTHVWGTRTQPALDGSHVIMWRQCELCGESTGVGGDTTTADRRGCPVPHYEDEETAA